MFPPIKVFGNAGGPDHDVPLPHAALSGRTFEIMGGDGTRYVAPETFDEWLAGLDNRPLVGLLEMLEPAARFRGFGGLMNKTDSAAICACAAFAAMVLADKTGHLLYVVLFAALCGVYVGRTVGLMFGRW